MTIARKVIPTYKELTRNLTKELNAIHTKSSTIHNKNELAKQEMLLKYKNKLNQKLVPVESKLATPSEIDPQVVKNLTDVNHINDTYKLHHIKNTLTFLSSQREYQELLERYNPGLTMTPDENLSRSANRVGLKLPKQKEE